jgi:hypothetical protein
MGNLMWGLQMNVLGTGLVFGSPALMWGLLKPVQRLESESAALAAPGCGRPRAAGRDGHRGIECGVVAACHGAGWTPNWWPRSWQPRSRTLRCAGARPRR